MQGTGSVRRDAVRVLAALVATAVFGGCHRSAATPAATVNSSATATSVAGRAFGDSVNHAVRVLSFDREKEQANVFVAQPDNVIVLVVEPGRDIEMLFPGRMTVKRSKAENTFAFDLRRYQMSYRESRSTVPQTREPQSYQYCLAKRGADWRSEELAAKQGKGDTTAGSLTKASTQSKKSSQPCEISRSPNVPRLVAKQLPPRAPRERYLVVLSSSSPIGGLELEQRILTLTTVAPDVALTMEALAAGIYAGRPGTWGGKYVSW